MAKAARILRCFDPGTSTLTVRDIARRTGFPRSTCHAICSTLVAERMLELRPGGGYVLGAGLLVMGGPVVQRPRLLDAAVPSMDGLATSIGGEVDLGQLDDTSIVHLHRVRAARWAGGTDRPVLRVPVHTTGCGRAAMSAMDVDAARHLAVSAGVRPDAVDRLMADLRDARARGFVITTSPGTGFASVAAPVTGHDGRVVGGLSLTDRRERFSPRRVATSGAAVREAAEAVSRRLAPRRDVSGPAGHAG